MFYILKRRHLCFKNKIGICPFIFLICLFLILSCILYNSTKIYKINFDYVERVPVIKEQFLINTEGCKIPWLDPFDDKILKFLKEKNSINCHNNLPHKEPLTYFDNNLFRLNRSALFNAYNSTLEYCEYQEILKPNISNDDVFEYTKSIQLFFNQQSNQNLDSNINLILNYHHIHDPVSDKDLSKVEFMRIACYSEDGNLIYTNFHAHIVKKSKTYSKINKNFKPYNFLVLGVDSISRLNSLRYFVSTRSLLHHKLNAIEFNGFNKVADNTFVNLVPMFLGKFVEEIVHAKEANNDNREGEYMAKRSFRDRGEGNDIFKSLQSGIFFDSDGPFDEFDFIWKKFNNLGYKTLFAEDAPKISIFNYNKRGFYKQPADHYLRPFSVALEDHGAMWSPDRDCVGTKLETEVVLDYVTQFLQVYKSEPHFAFAFLTRLTHEVVGKSEIADQVYFQFFDALLNKNLLKNTIVLFYSDHGMRFGEMRQTFQGKLEERLPFLFIVLPTSFHEAYPILVEKMKNNVNALITPFDVHQTLLDIYNIISLHSDSRRDYAIMDKRNEDSRNREIFYDSSIREKETDIYNKSFVNKVRGLSLFNNIPKSRTCDSASIATHWCVCQMTISLSVNDHLILSATDHVIDYINEKTQKQTGIDQCAFLRRSRVINAWRIEDNNDILYYDSIKQAFKDVDKSGIKFQIMFSTVPGNGVFEVTIRGFNLSSDTINLPSLDIDSNALKTEFGVALNKQEIESRVKNINDAHFSDKDARDTDGYIDIGPNNHEFMSDKVLKDASSYLIDEEVRMLWKVVEISRISAYGDNSVCVEDVDLKKYCYC